MKSNPFTHVMASVLLSLSMPMGANAQTVSAEQMVDSLNKVFGAHHGMRASHAKGVCVAGEFIPSGDAAMVTSAGLLHAGTSKVTGRFSIGGGNPKVSDKAKGVRGLALHLDSGKEVMDLVTISSPVFFASTPENFVAFLEARQPDSNTGKPDPVKVKAYNESHHDVKAFNDYIGKSEVTASYAQTPYWSGNAFRLSNATGKTTHARWRIEPVAGRLGLTEEQHKTLPDDFLNADLEQRLKHGPVEFELWLQIAGADDPVNDPTQEWPANRPQIKVGKLSLSSMGGNCDGMMFNPMQLPKGIAASDDPILQVRAAAYGVSLVRRSAH
ncbi:catalase family peroxidase [Ampullimonas aquatilis]|uniref:catalase family peroxidase n=1 Tax=Ampullimonas aquatilis TaxID=1341549 RepID=UPI003C709ACE